MNTLTGGPTVNVKEALLEKQYKELVDYSEKSRLRLLAAWSADNKPIVKKIINACEKTLRIFSEWIRKQNIESQMIYELGYLKGTVSSIRHVLFCEQKEEEAAFDYRSKLQYINHLADIVSVLEKEGSLSHSDLSQKLMMNQSTLSEAMKKILVENVISSTTSGKYKVYSLTDQGRHYAKYLKSLQTTSQLSEKTTEEKNIVLHIKAEYDPVITNNNKQEEKNALYEGDKALLLFQAEEDMYYYNIEIKSIKEEGQGINKRKVAEFEEKAAIMEALIGNKNAS